MKTVILRYADNTGRQHVLADEVAQELIGRVTSPTRPPFVAAVDEHGDGIVFATERLATIEITTKQES
jgi:hypothetical protein